jgi:hypothetical protein
MTTTIQPEPITDADMNAAQPHSESQMQGCTHRHHRSTHAQCYDPGPSNFYFPPSSTSVPTVSPTPAQPPCTQTVRPRTLPQYGPIPMVLNDMPSKDHQPTLAKRFPPIGHTNPPYSSHYPDDYPDSPYSRWLYDAFRQAHDTAMEEHDATPTCMPSPIDLNPWLTLPTAQWLYNWEPYVNTQVPTPTITGS